MLGAMSPSVLLASKSKFYRIEDRFEQKGIVSMKKVFGFMKATLVAAVLGGSVYLSPSVASADDLLTIDLGDLRPDLKGQRLRGRIEGRRVVPYFSRAELEAGRLPDPDALREGLGEIGATGRRLTEQMRRLDLVAELAARDEFGPEDPGEPGKDWARRLERVCAQRASTAGRASDLRITLGEGCPALDYRPLETVVLELLSNAIQSSRPGDAIMVDGRMEGRHYILRLCDEGVGLPEEHLEKDGGRPFGQTAPCGFGLFVVRFIVHRVGGKLESEANSDCSTCLRLTLPAR
jgi:signal transduction histidine kinase